MSDEIRLEVVVKVEDCRITVILNGRELEPPDALCLLSALCDAYEAQSTFLDLLYRCG